MYLSCPYNVYTTVQTYQVTLALVTRTTDSWILIIKPGDKARTSPEEIRVTAAPRASQPRHDREQNKGSTSPRYTGHD